MIRFVASEQLVSSEAGETIRSRRVALGWTQERLAKRAGRTVRTICALESRGRLGHASVAFEVGKALDRPAWWVMACAERRQSELKAAKAAPLMRSLADRAKEFRK